MTRGGQSFRGWTPTSWPSARVLDTHVTELRAEYWTATKAHVLDTHLAQVLDTHLAQVLRLSSGHPPRHLSSG